jgi:hypothetical protein
MEKADEYRKRAAAAEERASRTNDSLLKQQLLDVAQQWRALAARAEGTFRGPPKPGG